MQNKRFQSLASRLSLWIISLGALIFIAVLSTNYFLSRLLLEDYIEDIAQTTASSTVRKIETIFNTVAANADSLAAVIATSNVSEKQIHQTIKAFLNTNTAIYGMTVALEPNTLISSLDDFSPYYYKNNNRIAFSDLADSKYQYKKWAWYTEPKKLNAPIWSEPYFDDGGGGVLMTTYSTPIYLSHNKSFAGIATADIRLSWLDDIVKEIKIGRSGYGFILSKDDVVIAHPDKTIDLRALNKGDTGWKVVIVLPEKELISDINSLTLKISVIAIIGLLILLFIITVITRHLTSPLGKLATATQNIGTGKFDIELPDAVHNDEIGVLTEDFNSMRLALKDHIAEIQKTTAIQQKLESEIQIAKDIQMSMIPGAGNVSIKSEDHQLFALLRPARSVGGDLYFYQKDEEKLHFIIGDVSDKGIPAALFMAKTITLYTRALKDKLSPGETFTMMNDMLAKNNDACMFVTALCGNINLNDGTIIMANAGHMNPIVKNKNKTDEAEVDGEIALGLMESVNYSDKRFQLDKGSSFVMYTDGISEAHNKQGEQYTDGKLIELISTFDETNVDMIGNGIIDSVDSFAADTEQFDDITLLIIHFT
jgi:sigma-B regulation protein RsbU (phosphoserine phosphatase)